MLHLASLIFVLKVSLIKDEGLIKKIVLGAGNCDIYFLVLGVYELKFDICCHAMPGLENRPLRGQARLLAQQ